MRCIACLLVLLLAQEKKEDPWKTVEAHLDAGLASAKKRHASTAYAHAKKAVAALEKLMRDDWSALLTFKAAGWTSFKPNIQPSTVRVKGEEIAAITGTVNMRRPADNTIAIFYVSSSPAHVLSYLKQKRAGEATVKRGPWRITKRFERWRSTAVLLGENTVLTITLAKEDKALLDELLSWIDFDLATRLDEAAGKARSGS